MECRYYDVPCWLVWLIEEIRLLFVGMYDSILQAVVGVFNAIPLPDFFQNLSQLQLPSGVVYLANIFAVPEGLGIIVTSYTLSFILRRIPFIG